MVVSYDGAATGNTNRLRAWLNGASVSLSYTGTIPSTIGTPTSLRVGQTFTVLNQFSSGRVDDYRIWGLALDGTDAADLYASGLGRGIDAS